MEFSLDKFYRINRRILIWIALLVIIFLLRGFFDLVFMTFVLAFVATAISDFLQRKLHMSRRISVTLVFLAFLMAFAGFVIYVTPQVLREAGIVIANLEETQDRVLELKNDILKKNPALRPLAASYIRDQLTDEEQMQVYMTFGLTAADIGPNGPVVQRPKPEESFPVEPADGATTSALALTSPPPPAEMAAPALPDEHPTATGTLLPATEDGHVPSHIRTIDPATQAEINDAMMRRLIEQYIDQIRHYAPTLGKLATKATTTLLLALLFAFLITLDISRLTQEVRNLRQSRLHDFYEQTAGPVVRFAYVVGRAIQAQAMIACCNTALTIAGLFFMGIPSVAMLALVVFLCSFIPVLGVFLSTTPILLVALNSGGMLLALGVIAFVCFIHAIEAYLLNPLVYGKHLKINPVLVLIILFIGHHAFGVWGMLLGVPVAHYFMHDMLGVPVWSEQRLAPRERQDEGKPGSSLANLKQTSAGKDKHHPSDSGARVAPPNDK